MKYKLFKEKECEHNFVFEETFTGKDDEGSYNYNYWHDTVYKIFRCSKCLLTKTVKCGSVHSGARE